MYRNSHSLTTFVQHLTVVHTYESKVRPHGIFSNVSENGKKKAKVSATDLTGMSQPSVTAIHV